MPNYTVKDDCIYFRQSFPRPILQGLFLTLYALDIMVYDSGSKIYPYFVQMTESEFLSVLEMTQSQV